ncbi:midasin isoform X2 [Erpetoichthys calabaricus]|uniref:midasin isoform X2 n=1 Tax=Erpetoichthys calabaricus TaxID=27687 RepID=UPI002234166F|nr:midasin isoform X2 [Erpetoichthys calabaricus]
MEHLELNVSSLGTISKQIEGSRNEISKYLAKQIWTPYDRQCILNSLAQLLLEKDYTLLIGRHMRPFVLDLLERNAGLIKADGKINHDRHERLSVALSKLLDVSPDALLFAKRYFKYAPPVFQRLFFTSLQSASTQYGRKRMKLRDLMEATFRYLKHDTAFFKNLWDWSVCLSLLRTSDVFVRWYTACCLTVISNMTEVEKNMFFQKYFNSDEMLDLKIKTLEEAQQLNLEKALTLANAESAFWHCEEKQKPTRCQIVSDDLSKNVVAVCGVVLTKINPPESEKEITNLVLVDSTCRSLQSLAMAVASQKPVLLEGAIGSGKTVILEHLAAVTGRGKTPYFLKVQLGDQTDSKMLLGMYRCTSVPGEFVWQPGTLTQAVTHGHWIVLEDIDYAPLDVISVLIPLLESGNLLIPGRGDCIPVSPGFQFFATRRLYSSASGLYRQQNTNASLLDKLWKKIHLDNMSRDELKEVLLQKYSSLGVVVDRLLDIYCQLTGDKHLKSNFFNNKELSPANELVSLKHEEKSLTLEGRGLSLRDLLKWCDRIVNCSSSTSSSAALIVFLEALDCFTAMLSNQDNRQKMAEIIGSKLNISKEQAEHYCQMYKPQINLTETEVTMGRITIPRKQICVVGLSMEKQTFAATRPSLVLLEQLSACVNRGEPVLLVGETGTGKTSTVQFLARITGHKLRVVNMNQQSDTADLLGGYKPVDHKLILLPLHEAFEDLFSQTFSRKQNTTFLGHVNTCFRERRWQDLLKLMEHVSKSAINKELHKSKQETLKDKWEALCLRLSHAQHQIKCTESALLFAFVEGTLAQAVKKGEWILLDEINLAAAETLECLSSLLESHAGSLVLLDRGDTEPIVRHPEFRLFACMNPATDVGKRNLPPGIRNRFTEVYVEELEDQGDLRILILDYLKGLNLSKTIVSGIISFYLTVRKEANSKLVDGTGHKPHYSLRTLCRALRFAAGNPCRSSQRSLYEGFCLSFLTQLDRSSYPIVQKLICKHILGGNPKSLKESIPEPTDKKCFQVEDYWISRGELPPATDSSYILTPTVKLNLRDLARVVSAGSHPVLIQGETSVGKTSLIKWLASTTGNHCVRINNHEHTDIQEYIGCYASSETGKLVFKEGVLIDAMRKGYWIILDELNLAPTDVLEALNRLLDDNRELFVTETQETVKAHPRFMLFATQNPPGLYGGRKVLSRAFRNRFVELHFSELPSAELETILHQRCSLPPSYCSKLVKVMLDLQSHRRGSTVFAGKHGFITLRDLFRWAERYRLTVETEDNYDWLQHLADDGFMLLAGRVRRPEEAMIIRTVLEKHFKRKINPDSIFSIDNIKRQLNLCGLPNQFKHVVWTNGMRRLAILVGRALQFGEPVLLVGDTGCGKTTICQLFAALADQELFVLNCHLHMETSDFLGGLRPVRHKSKEESDDNMKLFEWRDGPLVLAMKEDGFFLMDEISLADDSVLERLNSILEPERMLVLAEKGSGDTDDVEFITASKKFRILATMNPGGDFGKKELSPALRNRFTEIWCPQSNSRADLLSIIQHNLNPGLSLDGADLKGKDIAELMLDFIDWLTNQEFGHQSILTVRDILSWINFQNLMVKGDTVKSFEAHQHFYLDPVTAFVHGACLVFIDGIGSGTTVSVADNALAARKACLDFLRKKFTRLTNLNEERSKTFNIYDVAVKKDVVWGADYFGIDPFYIVTGSFETSELSDYALNAGTTSVNAQRLLRAIKMNRPVLLEGSPGVGKTSLVAALAKASKNHLVRINLSEQTDVTDLFGTDLPVEGGKGGEFSWRDGPLLAALKAGYWIVLDELNLASQSVLEGLNACFDHRAEIYIPELGMTFKVQHERTKIFGCQNPYSQGGGRKGLPKSFLNRFTQVYVDQLSVEDMMVIGASVFPAIEKHIIEKMVSFNNKLVDAVSKEKKWGYKGAPWEFNLRDIFRWCQLMQTDQSPGYYDPGQHVWLVYADRMRTTFDKEQIVSVFKDVFGEEFNIYIGSRQFHITPHQIQVGYSILSRRGPASVSSSTQLSLLHQTLQPLESVMKCIQMGWMVILVGPAASGKTSLVQLISLLSGHKLKVMAMNSAMDTTELLGGFEQVEIMRPWKRVLETLENTFSMLMQKGLLLLEVATQEIEGLLHNWNVLRKNCGHACVAEEGKGISSESVKIVESIIVLLQKLDIKLKSPIDLTKLIDDFKEFREQWTRAKDGQSRGTFEWIDGILVQALQSGDWLLMDNVNFCSPSVLDRLNALLEPGGTLTISERGVIDGRTPSIVPHPDFRLFLTMDPAHGEISRAMRNRGVEIYVHGESEVFSVDSLDFRTLLQAQGITGDSICTCLLAIYTEIKETILGCPVSTVSALLHAASLLVNHLQRGSSLYFALQQACWEVFVLSQCYSSNQKQVQEIVEKHLSSLKSSKTWEWKLLSPGLWPDPIPSALQSTEDSCLSTIIRDGQVLTHCLNMLSLSTNRCRPLILSDLQQVLQSRSLDNLTFMSTNLEENFNEMMCLISPAVWLVTERASHEDWVLRAIWLSHLSKCYKHVKDIVHFHLEAGSKALRSVFSTKLSGIIWQYIKEMQHQTADEYIISMDVRWNLQYLDILKNSITFDSVEEFQHYMDGLNSMVNRVRLLMDRVKQVHIEEAVLYREKKTGNNSILRICKAFQQGSLEFEDLPYPVLAHIAKFFAHWDCHMEQILQTGKSLILDENLSDLQCCVLWRDRLWDISDRIQADSHGLAVFALHWNWVQKHLISKIPTILIGDESQEYFSEIQCAVMNIENSLCSSDVSFSMATKLQNVLGKPLPFKVESVAAVASQLKTFCCILDVLHLNPKREDSRWKYKLNLVKAAADGLLLKKSLLNIWCLVLQANYKMEYTDTDIEKLKEIMESQRSQMSTDGLLLPKNLENDIMTEPSWINQSSLTQLKMQTQMWPAMEFLTIISQYKLVADILEEMTYSRYDDISNYHLHLCQHINFCLRSTPTDPEQIQDLCFIQQNYALPAEEISLRWSELLSRCLSSFWRSNVTTDPSFWLTWNPNLNVHAEEMTKSAVAKSLMGPGIMNRAVWLKCFFELLTNCKTTNCWSSNDAQILSSSLVSLGEWSLRTQQLLVISNVLWTNIGVSSFANFRETDQRLQGILLHRHLKAIQILVPDELKEEYLEYCRRLITKRDAAAVQYMQQIFRSVIPSKVLPESFICGTLTCIKLFARLDAISSQDVQSGIFWVHMGLLQMLLWMPQTLFDPALKRMYKLGYMQKELKTLQSEWTARQMSSQVLCGEELKEDGYSQKLHHPRLRFLCSRMKFLRSRIAELSRKQAYRPNDQQYENLYKDMHHFTTSIAQVSWVQDLLSRLLKMLETKTKVEIQNLLNEEATWQLSLHHFINRLTEKYPLYPDIVSPVRASVLQIQHGMRLVASEVSATLFHVPHLSEFMSCLLAFPSLSPGFPSYLARAEHLCSKVASEVLKNTGKLLSKDVAVSPDQVQLLLNALHFLLCHVLSLGYLDLDTLNLFRHICQAVVNEWDELELLARQREKEKTSLYHYRSQQHGSGLSEEEEEEKQFRALFPQYDKDFTDIVSEPSLESVSTDNLEDSENNSSESCSISLSCMWTLIQVHQRISMEFSHSLWYQPSSSACQPKDYLSALTSSYQTAAPLMANVYHLIGCEHNEHLLGSQLLISALIQNTILNNTSTDLFLKPSGSYDFYQHANIAQVRLCHPVLEDLNKAVQSRLQEWPEHPALMQILVVTERILAFPISDPLAKFLNGLEILLAKAQDWEENASRSVSLRKQLDAVTQLIIQWRKLELNCWTESLDNTLKKHSENSAKHWFPIYQLLESHLQQQRNQENFDDSPKSNLSLSSVTRTLQAFLEDSTLGEFQTRLEMILSFHCHVLLIPDQEGKKALSSLLWNLYNYYKQFSYSIQAKVTELRHPIEKELKDFVKISRWNDVSFWSIKQSVQKTHRTLFKFVKRFDAALNTPCRQDLTEQGIERSLDCVDRTQQDSPVLQLNKVLKRILLTARKAQQSVIHEETPELERNSLQSRLVALNPKMRKMCMKLMKKSALPQLAEDLDLFTAEIIKLVQELQNLTVDKKADKEKQRCEAKNILQQKQRALSELFKLLGQTGLSYRKGITWSRTVDPNDIMYLDPLDLKCALNVVKSNTEPEKMIFAEIPAVWDGCQKYFYRSIARHACLREAFLKPSKELGLGTVERCKGFTAHLLKLLVDQRKRLSLLTEEWIGLRKLVSGIQDVQSQLYMTTHDDFTLPPQSSLLSWMHKIHNLSSQCLLGLQELSLFLQCCPDPTKTEDQNISQNCNILTSDQATESKFDCQYPTPFSLESLALGCRMRKGDSTWLQLTAQVSERLKDLQTLKADLDMIFLRPTSAVLQTWHHFEVCSSGLSKLGSLASHLQDIELFFSVSLSGKEDCPYNNPGIIQTLRFLRKEIEQHITEFTTWRTDQPFLKSQKQESSPEFALQFFGQIEGAISAVLCTVQSLVKRKEDHTTKSKEVKSQKSECKENEDEGDLIRVGHLTKLLDKDLSAEVSSLNLEKIPSILLNLLESLKIYREDCAAHCLTLKEACLSLVRLLPMLSTYVDLVQFFLIVSLLAHRSTGKLLSVLASIFTEIAQKGFCLPEELVEEASGEGATEFHDYEGGGIGEGEGTKDVSDKIENEEQVEDTFQQGQEKKDEEQDKKPDIKEEENAVEMSEDFDGQMHDGERKEPGEDEEEPSDDEEEDLDKKMGNLGEAEADQLDERLWGDNDDEEEDTDDEEDESGQGMDEGESQLVAKEDNLDAGNTNKDDQHNQHKEEELTENKEEKDKINEQHDKREFDENEVDPYHGKQEKQPVTEPMDLPDDLNLDNDEEDTGENQEGDEENPMDIEAEPADLDNKEEKDESLQEEQPKESEDREGKNEQGVSEDGEQEMEQENEGKEDHDKEADDQENESEENMEINEEEKESKNDISKDDDDDDNNTTKDEDNSVSKDFGHQSKEEEVLNEDENDLPESENRREHESDGQTGEENQQSDTAVELAGAASEKDEVKEEYGSGAADANQAEGHESKLVAQVSSQKHTISKTQSFKRKPGQADNERSTGDVNERVHKKLRTLDTKSEKKEKTAQSERMKQESDVYEHIKESYEAYDAQTYDVASAEQQDPAKAVFETDEGTDDISMKPEEQEDDLQAVDAQELKPEQNKHLSSKKDGLETAEMDLKPLEREEDNIEKQESEYASADEKTARTTESLICTVMEHLMDTGELPETPPEKLREQLEEQLEAWQNQTPGSQEEEATAADMWRQYQSLTSSLSQQLCEQLRLILEPTQAAKLKGDFRTGKRLNMRKVIPYIASQFRKDKIWLRRTKPSKREYQICLAIDDSSSMVDNHSKQMAFESLSVIGNALTLLEVGRISVCSFGESFQLLHPFHEQFNEQSGSRILRLCKFQQKKTKIAEFLDSAAGMFITARQQFQTNIETAQLLLIVSDGRGLFLEGKERVTAAVQGIRSARVFVIFVVLDNPNSRDSVLDIKVPIFKGPGEMLEIKSYMEEFPFPFYIILRDVNALPETLSDALRQWFELVTAADQ